MELITYGDNIHTTSSTTMIEVRWAFLYLVPPTSKERIIVREIYVNRNSKHYMSKKMPTCCR